jgi:hypothetical protein
MPTNGPRIGVSVASTRPDSFGRGKGRVRGDQFGVQNSPPPGPPPVQGVHPGFGPPDIGPGEPRGLADRRR